MGNSEQSHDGVLTLAPFGQGFLKAKETSHEKQPLLNLRVATYKDVVESLKGRERDTFIERLIFMYRASWANMSRLHRAFEKTNTPLEERKKEEERFRKLGITREELDAFSERWPKTQLVLLYESKPLAMLTTVEAGLSSYSDVPRSYNFLKEELPSPHDGRKVLYCISIVNGLASLKDELSEELYKRLEKAKLAAYLINYARDRFSSTHLIMPYSAPRSLRMYYAKEPSREEVEHYVLEAVFDEKKGIYRPKDSVINFHIFNGAMFVLLGKTPLVLHSSRPDDVMAWGYNILLAYSDIPQGVAGLTTVRWDWERGKAVY